MSNKQFQAGKLQETRQPIPQSRSKTEKTQQEGDKRPFTPSLPPLIQRAAQSPRSITPAEAAYLQRTVGNQALGRMLRVQTKMTVGPVGDKYEQEAVAVARQVVQNINAPKPQSIQKQEEDDDDDALQMQPLQSISTLQRQEDEDELQMKPFTPVLPHLPFLQRQETDEEELQMKPTSFTQRQEEEDELQMKPSSTMEGGEISSDIESQIQSAKGGGRPLATNTQSNMEQAFNADFSDVKVHTGSQSNQLNQSIQARAFTTGRDIFFRDGVYNPDNSSGQELLAHELTHVVQQTGAQRTSIQTKTESPNIHAKAQNNIEATNISHIEPSNIQRELIPEATQAFESAIATNPAYATWSEWTSNYMPAKHQEKMIRFKGKTKRFFGSIASLFKKKKEPGAIDKLQDFLRAFLLGQYAARLEKIKDLPENEKQQKRDKQYFPKALKVKNKHVPLIKKGVAAPETQTFLRDAGLDSGVEVTDEQKTTELAKGPRIDVRSTFLGGPILGINMRGHLFIIYTSSTGKQWYFRGGPDGDDPPNTIASIGEYTSTTVDWDPSAPSKTVLKGESAVSKFDALIEASSVIDDMEVPYVGSKWFKSGNLVSGENCNATAWTILDRAGIPKSKPFGTHPGWGHQLGSLLGEGEDIAPKEVSSETGEAAEICCNEGEDSTPLFRDRLMVEEMGSVADKSSVSILLTTTGDLSQIKTEEGLIGWVQDKDLIGVREEGTAFKIAGEDGSIVSTWEVDEFKQSTALVMGGQKVEVLDSDFAIGSTDNFALVKIRFTEGENEYEGRVMAKDLAELDESDIETETSDESSSGLILKPDSGEVIKFMNEEANAIYNDIDSPTPIEIIDPRYPDGFEGWENVKIKNLDTNQEGYIFIGDLRHGLGLETEEVIENIESVKGSGYDPADYPEGKHILSWDEVVELNVALTEDGPMDVNLVLDPDVFKPWIIVTDDLTTEYGRCRLAYNGKNYYADLSDFFDPPESKSEESIDKESDPVEDEEFLLEEEPGIKAGLYRIKGSPEQEVRLLAEDEMKPMGIIHGGDIVEVIGRDPVMNALVKIKFGEDGKRKTGRISFMCLEAVEEKKSEDVGNDEVLEEGEGVEKSIMQQIRELKKDQPGKTFHQMVDSHQLSIEQVSELVNRSFTTFGELTKLFDEADIKKTLSDYDLW